MNEVFQALNMYFLCRSLVYKSMGHLHVVKFEKSSFNPTYSLFFMTTFVVSILCIHLQ